MNERGSYIRSFIIILLFLCFVVSCTSRKEQQLKLPADFETAIDQLLPFEQDSAYYFHQLDSLYAQIPNPELIVTWTVYQRKSSALNIQEDIRRAHLYADSMLLLLGPHEQDPAYSSLLARTYFQKGDVFIWEHQYMLAFNWFSKVKKSFIISDPAILGAYNGRLATVSFKQDKFLEAANYGKQALQYYRLSDTGSFKSFSLMQGELDNIGIAYAKLKMDDSARYYYREALSLIEQNTDRFRDHQDFVSVAKAVVQGNLADVEMRSGNFAMAETLLQQSIRINEMPYHAPFDAALSRVKLARIYLKQNRIGECESMINAAERTNQTARHPFFDLTTALLTVKSEMAAVRGHYSNAYQYLSLYKQLADSVNRVNGLANTPYIKQIAENIDNDYRMLLLEKENRFKSGFLWGTIVIVLLLAVLILLMLKDRHRSRQHVRDLEKLHQSLAYKNAALQQTLSTLEQSQANQYKFMRVMAHDLRGPIGSIASLADLVSANQVDASQVTELMGNMGASARRSLQLINELLNDLSLSNQSQSITSIQLDNVIRYAAELYDDQIRKKSIKMELTLLPVEIMGDESRLWRVFSNLIGNAIKFSYEGGKVSINMAIEEEHCVIRVKDMGMGIPAEQIPAIFSGMVDGRKGTMNEQSFGLGLSIVKQIIQQHSGTIEVTSDDQHGTIFFIRLPLEK